MRTCDIGRKMGCGIIVGDALFSDYTIYIFFPRHLHSDVPCLKTVRIAMIAQSVKRQRVQDGRGVGVGYPTGFRDLYLLHIVETLRDPPSPLSYGYQGLFCCG
jgi:hypothetical protein